MGRLPVAVDGLSFVYGAVEPQLMRSGLEFAACVVSADGLPQHLRVVQALGGVEETGPRRPRLKECCRSLERRSIVNGLRRRQMVKEEDVAQAVSAWLGDCRLVVLGWPAVPPGCDLGGWLVWLEGACVNDAWRVKIGTRIEYRFYADEEDVGEVLPSQYATEGEAEQYCRQQDAEFCHYCSPLSVPGGSGSW